MERNAFRGCMRDDGALSFSVARYTLIENYDEKSAEASIQTQNAKLLCSNEPLLPAYSRTSIEKQWFCPLSTISKSIELILEQSTCQACYP